MVLCHATAECAPVDASAHGAGGELPLPDARTLALEPVGVGGARARVHCSERGERLLTACARAVLATESGGDGRVCAAAATRAARLPSYAAGSRPKVCVRVRVASLTNTTTTTNTPHNNTNTTNIIL